MEHEQWELSKVWGSELLRGGQEEDLATHLPNLYCRRHFGNVGKDDLERNETGGGRLMLWVRPEEGPSQAHMSRRHDMRLVISDG